MLDESFELLANALRRQGYCVLPGAVPDAILSPLFNKVHALDDSAMKPAAIGRKLDKARDRSVRRDYIRWISDDDAAGSAWLNWAAQLRLRLNRELLLGLFSFESHFAHYPVGAFYKKHVDAFVGEKNRTLSVVLYLNEHWQPDEGGELVLYAADNDRELTRVRPELGTLVVFLSEEFPHEVLPAARDRYSIAGWYRVNTSIDGRIDPPR